MVKKKTPVKQGFSRALGTRWKSEQVDVTEASKRLAIISSRRKESLMAWGDKRCFRCQSPIVVSLIAFCFLHSVGPTRDRLKQPITPQRA
jgi:hypothetical protein